jgi:hypothetical protein
MRAASFLCLAVLLVAGCVATVEATVPVAEPVAVVEVREAPPPVRVEVMTVQPSPNHIWIAGYWSHHGGGWVWNQGHWEARRHGHVWVAARNVEVRPGVWRYEPGHWRPQ